MAAGQCGCGVPDTDTDGDLTADCIDGCPLDPLKIAAGICGCGVADTDTDGDLTADCLDGCPLDPNKIAAGVCGCGTPDTDTDGDGLANCIDNCPLVTGVQGSSCTDGNPCTINDVLDALCVCVGTPDPVTAGVTASSPVYCTPGAGVTLTATGGVTYSWLPAAGLSAVTGSPVTATPASATTYTVTASNAVGCTGTATVTVTTGTTPATPVMSATPNGFCPGGNSQLGAQIGGAAPSYCAATHSTGCVSVTSSSRT
ncbi:MAG: thrombospondin type 3 repeat-containing protein [Flavobacteriales bacterium]|nr:thrombospondin type 3 repeat-containing protein [Flavobacteriales bacterium]